MKGISKTEYQDDRKLRSEYQKVLISKAVREIRDEEVQALIASSPEDQHDMEFLAENREKRLKKLIHHLRWIELKNRLFTVVPRTTRFAVAALGVLCIGLTTAFASNETFRVHVFSMFTEDHEQYTAVKLKEDEQKAFDVPNGWEGMYYPSYIPAEFEIESVDSSFGREFSVYMRDKNNSDVRLVFEEMSENNEMNVDTENARVYHTKIHGSDAIVSIKEKTSVVIWSESNRILSIMMDGDNEEQILRVAESVQQIK